MNIVLCCFSLCFLQVVISQPSLFFSRHREFIFLLALLCCISNITIGSNNVSFNLISVDFVGLVIISLNIIMVSIIVVVVVSVCQFVEVEVVWASLKKWSWFLHVLTSVAIKNHIVFILN